MCSIGKIGFPCNRKASQSNEELVSANIRILRKYVGLLVAQRKSVVDCFIMWIATELMVVTEVCTIDPR